MYHKSTKLSIFKTKKINTLDRLHVPEERSDRVLDFSLEVLYCALEQGT